MRYVYVLSTDGSDYYAEQTAISIHSLRFHNPDAFVILVCDEATEEWLKTKNHFLQRLWDEIKVFETPLQFSYLQKSRFLKTSLRRLLEGDFVYIDADTVITDSLNELETWPCDLGFVKIQASVRENWSNPECIMSIYNNSHGLPENFNHNVKTAYNGGFFLCRDTKQIRDFFERWHKLWMKSSTEFNYHKDQTDLWITNSQLGDIINELPARYNCMAICYTECLKNLNECKVFHYFSSSSYCKYLKIRNKEFLHSIRVKGLPKDIDEMIGNILKEYTVGLRINDRDEKKLVTLKRFCWEKILAKFPFMYYILKPLLRCYEKIF